MKLLEKIANPRAVEPLIDFLSISSSSWIKSITVIALVAIGDRRAIRALNQELYEHKGIRGSDVNAYKNFIQGALKELKSILGDL